MAGFSIDQPFKSLQDQEKQNAVNKKVLDQMKPMHGATSNTPSTPKEDLFKMAPMHGPEYQEQQFNNGLAYIGSHLGYVIVFLIFTLVLFYFVGKKPTVYFLTLVLIGQLVIPGGTGAGITELFKSLNLQ